MSLPVVPAGQRLTVEFVTALMIMQVPNSLVDVELAPIGGTTRAFLPINASPGSYSTSYFYTVNQPSLAVFVAGETPVLSVYANTNNNYDVRASITGFLATAP